MRAARSMILCKSIAKVELGNFQAKPERKAGNTRMALQLQVLTAQVIVSNPEMKAFGEEYFAADHKMPGKFICECGNPALPKGIARDRIYRRDRRIRVGQVPLLQMHRGKVDAKRSVRNFF